MAKKCFLLRVPGALYRQRVKTWLCALSVCAGHINFSLSQKWPSISTYRTFTWSWYTLFKNWTHAPRHGQHREGGRAGTRKLKRCLNAKFREKSWLLIHWTRKHSTNIKNMGREWNTELVINNDFYSWQSAVEKHSHGVSKQPPLFISSLSL